MDYPSCGAPWIGLCKAYKPSRLIRVIRVIRGLTGRGLCKAYKPSRKGSKFFQRAWQVVVSNRRKDPLQMSGLPAGEGNCFSRVWRG